MPDKTPTDEEAIRANIAIEVLNQVKYGGKTREPSAGMAPSEFGPGEYTPGGPEGPYMEAGPGAGEFKDKDPRASPWELAEDVGKRFLVPVDQMLDTTPTSDAGGVIESGRFDTPAVKAAKGFAGDFAGAWKTFLIGGGGGMYGRPDVEHVPGLFTFPQETMEAIPAPPFGKVEVGGNLIDWLGRQGFPLLGRDEPSRRIVTDPIIVGSLGPGMLKQLGREAAGSRLADYSRNALQWSMKVGDETGHALNLTPKLRDMWKHARDASRLKWMNGYDAMEHAVWNKMRTEKMGPLFNGDMRNFLKSNFETSRVKWGEGLSDGFRDVSTARILAKIETLPTVERLREVASASDNLALSRYMRPRVVGGEKVWPEHLSKKFTDDLHRGGYEVFQPDLKLYMDNNAVNVERRMAENVDLNMMSRNVHAEYGGDWYPRKYQGKEFYSPKSKPPGGPAEQLHFARDGYGVRLKMSADEARTLMKGTGGELPADKTGDLAVARLRKKLDDVNARWEKARAKDPTSKLVEDLSLESELLEGRITRARGAPTESDVQGTIGEFMDFFRTEEAIAFRGTTVDDFVSLDDPNRVMKYLAPGSKVEAGKPWALRGEEIVGSALEEVNSAQRALNAGKIDDAVHSLRNAHDHFSDFISEEFIGLTTEMRRLEVARGRMAASVGGKKTASQATRLTGMADDLGKKIEQLEQRLWSPAKGEGAPIDKRTPAKMLAAGDYEALAARNSVAKVRADVDAPIAEMEKMTGRDGSWIDPSGGLYPLPQGEHLGAVEQVMKGTGKQVSRSDGVFELVEGGWVRSASPYAYQSAGKLSADQVATIEKMLMEKAGPSSKLGQEVIIEIGLPPARGGKGFASLKFTLGDFADSGFRLSKVTRGSDVKARDIIDFTSKRASAPKMAQRTGSAVKGSDLTKGRAELDPIYSGAEGDITFVKFSPQEYGGSEEAAAAARDELMKRASNAGYKTVKSGNRVRVNPFTEAELAEMGELTDAADNMFSAIEVLETRAAKGRVFRYIDRIPNNGGSMTAEEAAAAGVDSGLLQWKRLPNSNRWGDLAGKYIEPDIYRKMVEMDNTLLGPGMRIYRHVVKNNKAAFTIWSAPTWMRNFFGNVGFSAGGDALVPWGGGLHNWKVYKDAVFTKFGSPRHVEYIKNGIDGVQLGQVELGMGKGASKSATIDMFKEMFKSRKVPSWKAIADSAVDMASRVPYGPKSMLTEGLPAESLAKGYNSIDTLVRRGMYNKARDVWGWDQARATAHVNKFTQNYAEVPNAIRLTRQNPGGAMFGAFPAESTRIGRNMIRENPIKAALAMGGGAFAMSRAHKWMSGMSDEEYEGKVRNHGLFHVTWPFRNDEGNFKSYPTDYINPFGWALSSWFGNIWTKKEEQEAGASGWDAQVMRFLGVMRSFVLNETAFNLGGGAVAGKDLFTGRPIQKEGEEIVPAYAEWFAQGTLPSQFPPYGRNYQEQMDYAEGRAGYKGKERTAADTFLRTVVGLKSQEYDPDIEMERWGDQAKWAVGEMKRQINAKRKEHTENTRDKTPQQSKLFDDELRKQTSVIAEKYAAIIREGKERKFLAMIVLAQRDMEQGKEPRYDIGELKLLLKDVRAKKDMPGTQRKIEGKVR